VAAGRILRAELTNLGVNAASAGRLLRAELRVTGSLTAPTVTAGTVAAKHLTRTVAMTATTGATPDAWEWAATIGTLPTNGAAATFTHPPQLNAGTATVSARYRVGDVWSPWGSASVSLPRHHTWVKRSGALVPSAFTARTDDTALDVDALATGDDVPTFTYAAITASAGPTISGSAGWLREKRTGVAEVAAGGTQTSTAELDLTGSTRFRYSGVPAAAGWTSNAGQYVETDYKPGGSSQNAKWLFNVEFVLDGADEVEIRLNAPSANPRLGMVVVNGRRILATPIIATAAAGGGYSAKLTFPTIARRHIKIYGLNGNQGRFGGVAVPAGGTVTKPTRTITRRVAIIGDSFTNGANGVSSVETFAWDLARKMHADEVIQAGIGGTGFINQINSEAASVYAGRIATVMGMNPHAVVFVGGRNDGNDAGLQAAVEACLDATAGVERWVVSQDLSSPGNLAIKAAANGRTVPFADMSDHMSTCEISNDGVHPTFAGHRTFANLAWERMQAAVGVSTTAAGRIVSAALLTEAIAPADPDELVPATGVPTGSLFFELPTLAQINAGHPDRKVFGHYFAPYPITLDNQTPDTDYYARNYLAVNGESGIHAAYGGMLRDRPATAAPYSTATPGYVRRYSADEIQHAKEAGIDGLFCNIMGASGQNWDRYVAMADEASANYPGFLVVPMIDTNGGIGSESTATIAARINTFLSKACRWRLDDGRYVVASYKADGKTLSWWQEVLGLVQSTHGKDAAFIGVYSNINLAVNYAAVNWGAGRWGGGADPAIINNATNYGAAIHARGEKYLCPVWAQDIRYSGQNFDEARNTEALRADWGRAIADGADIVQLCTWSDYSEGSQHNPSAGRGAVTQDLDAYYIAQWKTGKKPRILRDAMYVSHRNQMLNATITGGQTKFNTHWARSGRSSLREAVEILTFLTAPATVSVKVGSSTYSYTAPAGMNAQLYPMEPGEVSAKAVRSGLEVARVNSPYVIKSTSVNMDRAYFMAGSIRGTSGQYDPTPGSPTPNPANYIT